MLRNKLTYKLIALAAVIIICIAAGISLSTRDSILSIQNITDVNISGLKIKYSNSIYDTKVPEILPKQIYKANLILPEDFTAGTIKVLYTDKLGQNHEEFLSGYIEKGYKEKIRVTISSVETNGVLSIKLNKSGI